jgi:hypothetical protein
VADLAMIDNLMARMQADTSVYAECFKEAYGVTISQAKLRVRDEPPPIRRILNILCSVRKLDGWKSSVRQEDRSALEEIATNLIARFLEMDVETGMKFFAAGTGCRQFYEKMACLCDKWK